ncbi:MAG: CapA family protein [Dehalococcoidia bacterium]|nr:CapA family protein [Dehalococcoidia bacterium]
MLARLLVVAAVLWLAPAVIGCSASGRVDAPPTPTPTEQTTSADPTSTTSQPATAPSPTPTPSPTPAPRWPLTIAAVGDIMLGRGVAAAITPDQPAGPFLPVIETLRGADITVGNLECIISDLGEPEPKAYTFRAPPLAAAGLAAAGFDLVSVANNHSLDYGPGALFDTIERLAAVSVQSVGAGAAIEEAYAARTLEVGGVRVAFLGLAEVPNEAHYRMQDWAATASSPGIAWIDDDRMAAAIQAARADADIVVVMLHFGIEGASTHSDRQRAVAHAAIDAGARLVIGSHPHVLQGVEEYGGGVIAYSLGNFVFDGFEGAANDSGILLATFNADGSMSWRIAPVTIEWDGLPRPDR